MNVERPRKAAPAKKRESWLRVRARGVRGGGEIVGGGGMLGWRSAISPLVFGDWEGGVQCGNLRCGC